MKRLSAPAELTKSNPVIKALPWRPSLVSVFQWLEVITNLMCTGAHAVNLVVVETPLGSCLVPIQNLLMVENHVLETLKANENVIHSHAQVRHFAKISVRPKENIKDNLS